MPFDGTNSRPAAVAVIDRAIDLLGPNGERWIQNSFTDKGSHCILGALRRARHELGIKGDRSSGKHILRAITVIDPRPWVDATLAPVARQIDSIANFNDQRGRKFRDVALVLTYARGLAAGEKPTVMRVGGNVLYIALECCDT